MDPRTRLFISLIFAAVAFVGLNLAMGRWSDRLPAREKAAQVGGSTAANVLLIGNSLLDARINARVFEVISRSYGVDLIPLNAALGASQPADQYLLFREFVSKRTPTAVVIGFFDFQLTHDQPTTVEDLIGNRAVAFDHRIRATDAEFIYQLSSLDRIKYLAFRMSPVLSYRANAWKYVEMLRRRLHTFGLPSDSRSNEFGRVADLDAIEYGSVRKFDEDASAFAKAPARFNEANQRMIDQTRSLGARPVLLLMPISPFHRRLFYSRESWDRYLRAVRGLASGRGATVQDGSDWFPDEDDFVDHLHLSASRTDRLSAQISRMLVTRSASPGTNWQSIAGQAPKHR